MSDLRSELAIKRDEWFASEEGQKCAMPFRLPDMDDTAVYLRNRLELAFLAGAKTDAEVQEEFAAKVLGQVE